jgi:hypothetical protein
MAIKVIKPEVDIREKVEELNKPSGVAGEAMLRAETPQEQFSLIGAGRRNMLYNGAMTINQRGSITNITATTKTLDRWKLADGTGGAYAIYQSTNAPPDFKKSMLFNVTTADTGLDTGTQYLSIAQNLEGQDVQHLAYGTDEAKPVTLSFWVKSSKAGTFASELEIIGAKVNVQSWKINSPDTWEYKTITFDGNTETAITSTTSVGLYVTVAWIAAGDGISGTSFKSGWRALNQTERLPHDIPNMADSTSNNFRVTGCQLEVGRVATPFEHRPYGEELKLCERYLQLVPIKYESIAGQAYSSTAARFPIQLPVEMRALPQFDIPPPGSSGYSMKPLTSTLSWPGGTGSNTATAVTNKHFYVTCTNYSGLVAGNASQLYATDLSNIICDAEL